MARRPVSTRTHGIIDYITGPTLVAAPKIFRIEDGPVSSASPRLAGAGATAYSMLTDYELGAVKAVPMRVHLALDAVGGAALAAAPWLSGEAKRGVRYWLPHALVGSSELALALLTKTQPDRRRRRARRLLRALGRGR